MREHSASCPNGPFECFMPDCQEHVTNASILKHFRENHVVRQARKDEILDGMKVEALRVEAAKLGVDASGSRPQLLARVKAASPWKCCLTTWEVGDHENYAVIGTSICFDEDRFARVTVRFSGDGSQALFTAHASGEPVRFVIEVESGHGRDQDKAAFTMMSRPLREVKGTKWSIDEIDQEHGFTLLLGVAKKMCIEGTSRIAYSLLIYS